MIRLIFNDLDCDEYNLISIDCQNYTFMIRKYDEEYDYVGNNDKYELLACNSDYQFSLLRFNEKELNKMKEVLIQLSIAIVNDNDNGIYHINDFVDKCKNIT